MGSVSQLCSDRVSIALQGRVKPEKEEKLFVVVVVHFLKLFLDQS